MKETGLVEDNCNGNTIQVLHTVNANIVRYFHILDIYFEHNYQMYNLLQDLKVHKQLFNPTQPFLPVRRRPN